MEPTQTIQKTSLPEGYAIRAGRLDDAAAIARMVNAWAQIIYGQDDASPQMFLTEWQSPDIVLDDHTRVVLDPGGQIIAAADVWVSAPWVKVQTWHCIHPEHEGKGIRECLLQWQSGVARATVERAPQGTKVTMTAFAPQQDQPAAAIRGSGMTLNRYFWRMMIDLADRPPTPTLPAGITIRALEAGESEYDALLVARDAFRDHWGYVEHPLEDDWKNHQHWINTDPTYDHSLRFVAMDGDQVIGVSLCWPHLQSDPEMGWVGTLGVVRSHRQRGIAKALLLHSFRAFYDRKQKKAGLGVDAGSLTGATRLYESAGMKVVRQYSNYELVLREGEDLSTQTLSSEEKE